MAASDSPATVTEMQTAFFEGLKEPTGNTALNTIALRYLNTANHLIHQEGWPWSERRAVLRTHPGYSTGTVDLSLSARTTVTGTDTLWTTAVTGESFNNARAGGKLTFAGGTDVYVVSAVGAATTITLEDGYAGTAALDDATYQDYEDEYGLPSDFDRPRGMRFFTEDRMIRLVSARDFSLAYPRNSRRNRPQVATLILLAPSGDAVLNPRVLLGPAPDITYRLPYRYYTHNWAVSSTGTAARNLSAATDEPIIPHKYRMVLVRKAMELWARDRKDDPRAQLYRGEAEAIFGQARAEIQWDATGERPRFTPKVAVYWNAARYPYTATRGSRRYSTDTRFDTVTD